MLCSVSSKDVAPNQDCMFLFVRQIEASGRLTQCTCLRKFPPQAVFGPPYPALCLCLLTCIRERESVQCYRSFINIDECSGRALLVLHNVVTQYAMTVRGDS